MKTAVIYYSLDGNCAFIAERIGAELKADLFRVELEKEKKTGGFFKYVWGGRQVFAKKKPPIKVLNFAADQYDLIILGTPVWAASPAPALCSFLEKNKIAGKKTALFCCHAGGKGRAMEKFRALLGGNTIAAEIDFVNPLKQDREGTFKKLADWLAPFKTKGQGA